MPEDLDLDEACTFATPCRGWLSVRDASLRILERRPGYRREGLSPHSLALRVRALRLDASELYADQPVIRSTDLHKIFSPVEIEIVAPDLEELEGATVEARMTGKVLGLQALVPRDLASLLSRRGVLVPSPDGRMLASISGICWLSRIMAAERRTRPSDEDWSPTPVVLSRLRAAMVGDLRGDPTPDEELDARADLWGIRTRVRAVDDGFRQVRVVEAAGLDLYRLCGITIDGEKVAGYREVLRAAYASVIGGGSVEPEGRIIEHAGRKVAIIEEVQASPGDWPCSSSA